MVRTYYSGIKPLAEIPLAKPGTGAYNLLISLPQPVADLVIANITQARVGFRESNPAISLTPTNGSIKPYNGNGNGHRKRGTPITASDALNKGVRYFIDYIRTTRGDIMESSSFPISTTSTPTHSEILYRKSQELANRAGLHFTAEQTDWSYHQKLRVLYDSTQEGFKEAQLRR